MTQVKRRMQNQAIGLIPILLFMFLDNFFSYKLSFIIAVVFCLLCIFLYQILSKDKVYQFMLLPAATTFILYALFIVARLEPVLFAYSPILTEVLLVVVLAVLGFFKRYTLRRIRDSRHPGYKRTQMRTTLNEFYFLVQIVQNLYTLHLFIIIFFTMLPEDMQNMHAERFLYRELGIIIGIGIIIYEQIRLSMMQGRLKKEMWLPVLDDSGKVIGCMARSVSRSIPKKYYHPIVRIVVVYQGKLYLAHRKKDDFVSPDTLDHPLHQYVIFRHTIDNTVKEIMSSKVPESDIAPRSMIHYTYENDRVKHLVYLFVICVRSEEQFEGFKQLNGKLWTTKQIEENIGKGVFSGYFEEEFPYLKNTVLFAENYCGCNDN